MEAALAGDQPWATSCRARELHRRVDRLSSRACEEHRVQPLGQALRKRLREHARERRVMDLHAIDEVPGKRRLQDLANVRMVVAEARKALAAMQVQISATCSVIQIRAPRRHILRIEAKDAKHV